ncbi:P-loop containing nucleoside triphosphate hydrolase protein [Lasiosphaeria hispida]|uniref:P-loop containing nucleoside triphosphate hydrolase protein n=1 Tax=Lasiosphaeria hispida TaxID=260671 RepID=A0AAJ0MFC8_9PEZI|nr:P-loop containing nucleoside triphosphate hydrolase protein [Lasiosphaeria hispida]
MESLARSEPALASSLVALPLAFLLSIPAALGVARGPFRHVPPEFQRTKTYSDEDGEATDSDQLWRVSGRWQRVTALVSAVAGLTASLVVLLPSPRPNGHTIALVAQSGIWVLVILQAAVLFFESWPTERFRLSKYVACTAVLTSLSPGLTLGFVPDHTSGTAIPLAQAQSAQLIATLACIACSAMIPRRPDVFHDGRLVDRQSTVSTLSRFSFGWASDILQQVAKNPDLGPEDLPELPHAARSDVLLARLERRRASGRQPLWQLILATHFGPLLFQILVGMLSAVMNFGPQVALFGILKALESRESDTRTSIFPSSPWLWVFVLAFAMVLNSVLGARLSWIVLCRVGTPIQSELVSMIFAKSMKLKNSTMPPQNNAEGGGQSGNSGQRSVVTLAAVDARRIAFFASSQYLISVALVEILVACGLLFSLIGMESLLAGLAVAALVTPLNIFLTRRVAHVQGSLMKATDGRISALVECLQGIRQVKFSALEGQWQARILARRQVELGCFWTAAKYHVALISLWLFLPIIMSAVSLSIYALTHGTLTASVAFTATSIFSNLDAALAGLPGLLSRAVNANVSARRIEAFLDLPEKEKITSLETSISMRGATVAWPASVDAKPDPDRFLLANLNLDFPVKGLTLITGRTGCGKTLLLTSILGDCNIVSGAIHIPVPPTAADRHDELASPANWVIDNALAYVSQTPWIENATVRDNILMGLPYVEPRYHQVLFATCLEKDLDIFSDGDLTDIGANGANLSGGQKWRIAFARALYSRAGTLVIDDIFSALDAHTSHHILENGLTGEIAEGRTRILATHHVGLCIPRADYCVILDQGCVHAGSVEALAQANILSHLSLSAETAGGEAGVEVKTQKPGFQSSEVERPNRERSAAPLKFVQDEERATGSNSWTLYVNYLIGDKQVVSWALAIIAFAIFTSLMIGRSLWMSVWTSSTAGNGSLKQRVLLISSQQTLALPSGLVSSKILVREGDSNLSWYIGIYVGISVATCVMGAVRALLVFNATLGSSRNLFESLLHTVLRAPMRWFDTVPQGRILNRFVADMSLLDTDLSFDILFGLQRCLEMIGIAATAALVCPPLMLPAIVFLALCVRLGSVFLAGAREIKRMESVARSPIYEQLDSCIQGLTTIRAFGLVERYVRMMHGKINDHARASWHLSSLNSWITLRLTLMVSFFSAVTAAVVVHLGSSIPASAAGLILSLVLRYNLSMVQAVKQCANLEMDMSAVERVVEYATIATEDQGGKEVPAAWPSEGLLQVENLVAGYAPELPPSLDGLSFTILPNQRVGIVGRTGAGKSSLSLALFRFLEARSGRICIDGIDISKIKLQDLRSRLAIIPQDPVLFSGSLRANIDPFNQYEDMELYEALEKSCLVQRHADGALILPAEEDMSAFPSLSTLVSEGGHNLSQGQRQLICLARAVLSRPKILVMDEATSAIDMETDASIQKSLRSEFGRNSTTLLVVAHRLSTVADFDRIVVMDAGRVVEFDSPRNLMGIRDGIFRSLVERSGEREELLQIIFGAGS